MTHASPRANQSPSAPSIASVAARTMASTKSVGRLLRLPDVLKIIPVSRSTWYAGVRAGAFPKPVRLSARISAWPESVVLELAERLAAQA